MINSDNSYIGGRIRLARTKAGLTQTELAHQVGIEKHFVILNYETIESENNGASENRVDKVNLQILIKIAEVLKVNLDWLLTGKGSQAANKTLDHNYQAIDRYAPVIDWLEIKTWKNNAGRNMNLARFEHIPITKNEPDTCFGLKITDDSMISNVIGIDSFKIGDIVIIDPYSKPTLDSFIIASVKDELPILRQFSLSNKGAVLKPLNNRYPELMMTDEVTIYGVVVALHRKF